MLIKKNDNFLAASGKKKEVGRKLSSGSQAAGTRGSTIGELGGRYQGTSQ